MKHERDEADFTDTPGRSRVPSLRTLLPRGPKKFQVIKAGTGVRATITDWDHESVEQVGSGATSYLVYWAETVDMTTDAGVSAGFARATLLAPAIPAPGKDDGEASAFFADPKYQNGYFYCVGVDADLNQSIATVPVHLSSGIGGTVPSDVEHFQATESGEQHNGTTISAVSYSFRLPANGAGTESVQFFFKNYPNLNETSEGESVRVTVGPLGTQVGKLTLPIGRRIGTGTITIAGTAVTGVGTNFLAVAAAAGGDQLEIMGFRARIASVASNTSMTLSATWPAANPAVSGLSDWQTIASVTIYAIAEGHNGAHRDDVENTSAVQTIDLDGDLSVPNSPSMTAITIGNIIRIEIAPPTGTQLARILLYRATGAGVTWSKTATAVIATFAIDNSNSAAKTFQWDDSDFTTYQREQQQTFSYFVTAVNVRDQESAASTRAEASCRLDSPGDGSGTMPARFVAKNLLWNAMLSGDAGDINAATNASVDANMGVVLPAGYIRPAGLTTGAGSAPAYQNGREILLAIAGAVGSTGQSIVSWSIHASDHATAADRRVPKGKMVSLQTQARHSAGTINGFLKMAIVQTWSSASGTVTNATNATPIVITTGAAHGFATGQKRVWISGITGNTAANGVWTITVLTATTFSLDGSVGNGAYIAGGGVSGFAGLKHRSSSDVVDYDGYELTVAGSDITDVHSLYWGAFYLDPAFITEAIQARIYYETTNYSGVNLAIMEPMLALGDGIPYFSAEIDPNTTYPPVGGGVIPPKGRFTDLDGGKREFIRLP